MTISAVVGVLAAVVGSTGVGAIVTALIQGRRNSAQSETEARAQFTAEFEAVVGAMNAQYDRLEKEVDGLRGEVQCMRSENRRAEDYIDLLIIGITNGTIPPIPERL